MGGSSLAMRSVFELTFRIDMAVVQHLLESPLSVDQQVKELNDQFQINATVAFTAQFVWWLRGFGEQLSEVQRKEVN